VDPGLTRCGVGVVDGAPGRALRLVRVGVIKTSASDDIATRLLAIETEIEAWLDACHPDAVAVERVFSQLNVRTVMGTAQAGAVAIVCAARRGLPVALHTPTEVKAAVTGSGRADKNQVTAMVMRLLRITDPPRPADAASAGQQRRQGVIAHLRGTVAGVAPDGAVIEVGGVGMRVQCTPGTLATLKLGESAQVATSLVVREDSLTLYGFTSDDERNVFELLQTASGVGPRLALAMLAVHTPDALRRAVSTEDLDTLTMVPGIGKKGAQRIVLEMRDRLGPPGSGDDGSPGLKPSQRVSSWRDQVQSGLVNLGWPVRDADQAIAALEEEGTVNGVNGEEVNVATVLRAALRKLSKQ
jgi:Holliday junction DNA helicase RuvA